MSKSMNMLRTRRRDNNVKPNRKLDRKSSRGMIYENEELRLKTININAEVERGQSDIKKLKRENEMLKKEMWCLRDAYDKLDKLIKEKEINFSSSSTTCSTSEAESCSTCSSDSNEVETNQNLENVQKTNLKSLHVEFDHLSVVPEENSTENSDKNSLPNDANWNDEKNVIKPDQSYPSFETLTKPTPISNPTEEKIPKHFFSPIKLSKSCDGSLNNEYPYFPGYNYETQHDFASNLCPLTNRIQPAYGRIVANQNLNVMHPMSKSSTDLIVKMDNHNFANTATMTSSSFSNGGNLEELLNDIESISQDILKLSNPNLNYNAAEHQQQQQQHQHQQQQHQQQPFLPAYISPVIQPQPNYSLENIETGQQPIKPYKSELNVVLMPNPMPLIGFDKYRTVQNSIESLKSKSSDKLNQPDLPIQPDLMARDKPEGFYQNDPACIPLGPAVENPFYFGTGNDYFTRYNPDNYINNSIVDKNKINDIVVPKTEPISNEAVNTLTEVNPNHWITNDTLPKSDSLTNAEKSDDNSSKEQSKSSDKKATEKQPKLSIRRKVSIHFKGKKTKNKQEDKSLATPKTTGDKKSLFDMKKTELQKTPSVDSKRSNFESQRPNFESQHSNFDSPGSPNLANDPKRTSEPKSPYSDCKSTDQKSNADKQGKTRKSHSLSPEKHVHVKEDSKKPHKKHKKSSEKLKNRRSTISNNEKLPGIPGTERFLRERSFSVCTDRSNVLGLNYGSGYGAYDDYVSERERTNSLSSNGTVKLRKMSNISNFPVSGKLPWCGCWGNGCL